MKIYLSLGTNFGDRKANIEKALQELQHALGTPYDALSSIIETKSWGFDGPDFLNCAVRFDWKGNTGAHKLLRKCKSIERSMGRTDAPEYDADGKRIYHSRVIDIDILFYGSKIIRTPDLIIPHPMMKDRDFVLIPLREIADDAIKQAFPDIFKTK